MKNWSRVGGLPDLIEDHKTGRLVPPRDAEALAHSVIGLLKDASLASDIGKQAREFARQRFTVQRLLGDMHRLYRQLLADKAIPMPMAGSMKDALAGSERIYD